MQGMKFREHVKQYSRRIVVVFLAASVLTFTGCSRAVEEGTKLLEEGDYKAAQEEFRKSVSKEKDLSEAYRGLGICYFEQKEYGEAAKAFGMALGAGAEETATVYNMLGICAMETGSPEKAVYYFENGQNFPDAGQELLKEMSFNLVCAYEAVGEYVLAREKLEIYVGLYPDDANAAKELEFLDTQAGGQK